MPLSRDHQCLRLQWARECHHWCAVWQNVVFSDESCFNMSYNDGCICVQRYAGECSLRAFILQRYKGPMPSVMVWGAIGYNMRSSLIRIESNLNSNRYIREVLQPKVLPLLQATPHAIFQQGNARPHMARIVQSFFQRWLVSLACMFTRHVTHQTCLGYGWSATYHHGPPAPSLVALWTCIQTAWRDIPQEDIQGLFDSMPRRIETLIAAHGSFSPYWNHMLTDHLQFCNSNRLSIVMHVICGIHFISVTYLLVGVAIFTNTQFLWSAYSF